MKKTKIVCTMGPNTDNREIMRELALNGMDVARFNFSHGDHAEHKHRLEILESVREELGIPIASLLDTKGPEIRTGKLKDGKKVTAFPHTTHKTHDMANVVCRRKNHESYRNCEKNR